MKLSKLVEGEAPHMHSFKPFDQARGQWFSLLAQIGLVASIPLYFVALFLKAELGFIAAVEVPLLSASVLILLVTAERIERKLSDPNRSHIRTCRNHTEFYRELRAKVDSAKFRVFTSYLRDYPPAELGETAAE